MNNHQAPCGLMTINSQGVVVYINQTLCRWLSRTEASIIDRPFVELLTTPSRIFFLGHVQPLLQQVGHTEENYLSFKHGEQGEFPVLMNAQRSEQAQTFVYHLAVVTMQRRHAVEEQLLLAKQRAEKAVEERERAYNALEVTRRELEEKQKLLTEINLKLESLSTQDPLTGLYNRRVYDRELAARLNEIRRDAQPFSLMLLDLDDFKGVNDRHGHDKGDKVLKELSALLLDALREVDVLVRIGGEEFAALLPNTDRAGAVEVAERIRNNIHAHSFSTGHLTASIGVSEALPEDSKASLYERVDRALYRAKQLGRNQTQSL